MEGLSFGSLVELVKGFGVPGIVFVVWYFSEKSHEKTLRQYREDMLAHQKMYENNVELVKTTQALAKDQKDVLLMNAQGYQRLCDQVYGNQYCPMVRLKKEANGRQD